MFFLVYHQRYEGRDFKEIKTLSVTCLLVGKYHQLIKVGTLRRISILFGGGDLLLLTSTHKGRDFKENKV